jgi:aconitate hydratase
MGILPLQFKNDETAEGLGIEGSETFTIEMFEGNLKPNQDITIRLSSGKTLTVRCRLNTEVEIAYFKNGGILPYVLRKKI